MLENALDHNWFKNTPPAQNVCKIGFILIRLNSLNKLCACKLGGQQKTCHKIQDFDCQTRALSVICDPELTLSNTST